MDEEANEVLAKMDDLAGDQLVIQKDNDEKVSQPKVGNPQFNLFTNKRDYGVVDVRTGKISLEEKRYMIRPNVISAEVPRFEHSLPFRVGNMNSFILPMGLTIISGPTGSGKSSLIRELPDVVRLLAVEPPDNYEELATLEFFDDPDHALMTAVVIATNSNKLTAIDSLRAPLFETDGPAGSKGVIMPFFTALTRVSNTLALNGLTVLATVNPMDEDPEYVKSFLSKISSAVPCFIKLNPFSAKKTFEGTVYTRTTRGGVPFLYDPASKAKVSSEEVDFGVPESGSTITRYTNLQLRKLEESK